MEKIEPMTQDEIWKLSYDMLMKQTWHTRELTVEEKLMVECRKITNDQRKCEFCNLKFKCFTEDW